MLRIRHLLLMLTVLALSALSLAQPVVVNWSAMVEPQDLRPGEFGRVVVTADIKEGWKIYAFQPYGDEGPIPTKLTLAPGDAKVAAAGKVLEPKPADRFDANFKLDIKYHSGQVRFAMPFQLGADAKGSQSFKIDILYQACDATSCLRPTQESLNVALIPAGGPIRPEFDAASTAIPDQPGNTSMSHAAEKPTAAPKSDASPVDKAKREGLLAFMAVAFGAGLLALLTPCVFPMIPITVNYFIKSTGGDGRSQVRGAAAYSLGIISSFTIVGLAMTLLFGASGIQKLATNPVVNLFLAGLFIVLALSLFGIFELALPSGLVNRFSSGGSKGGLLGPILMGVTFSLTTFTCTVPFVGTVLIAATQGDLLYPALGMLAFSSAFAIPFFLLALFPQWLAKLPKSGSWLATVKAFMGFLELAAALKFISNVDLVYQWGLLTRPAFLSIWSTIMVLAALYLAGWIHMAHDSSAQKIGWVRRAVAVGSAACAVWFLAGIQGAHLGTLGSFMPPDPYPGKKGTMVAGELEWSEDYKGSLASASAKNGLVFIDFTGVTCTNCRWVEQNIFPDGKVREELERYTRVKLYTDRIGKDEANFHLQVKLTKQTTLPIYVILDPKTEQVVALHAGSDLTPESFTAFLQSGHQAVAQR
ncbi:MAG: hypothetical protein JNM85_11125 [Chthonomonas sp.]|nr:hypothetical protein [Chthonomonas sp.]